MVQTTMYPGVANSPQTELSAAIDNVQVTIALVDAYKLPAAPNIAVIGTDETAETILYTGIVGNSLTGVTRALEGVAKAWAIGSKVARNFTNSDHAAIRGNISDLDTRQAAHEADTTTAHGIGNKLDKGGGTMTGALILAGDPVNQLGASSKQYVDGQIRTSKLRSLMGVRY